ncbi:unnamed protein product [Nippostrongylus brasiliensis]|uniref:Transcription initiation factor TFIID subunit 8 n=1 Tax=Nippostrongylus brasiliensis TaxID=27835 RepID=A0A0N4Y1F3_NIPBR|nr:hypothetical protein Q1695_007971 [Nippostrongylus brasiliensis]VDL73037.1 unnamed protein product [Nippostrongylus brasiliensis]
MMDLCKVVSGLELSPDAEQALAEYSDDLLEELIDAICLETKKRKAYRIVEADATKSVEVVYVLPSRMIPRAMLKIFSSRAKPGSEVVRCPESGTINGEHASQKPDQQRIRPRKPIIDEARFLEDIRKMKPKDSREPQTYHCHKMTLEAKELWPRIGAAAVAEANAALERPARHFVGRPQPLITEDRGCVQPELTTYFRYRNYLGIVGPMPNIKPTVGRQTKIPPFLQVLQQRNEILGIDADGTLGTNMAQPQHMAPARNQERRHRQIFQPPTNLEDMRQALQRMHPHEAARMFHEFLQKQRRQKWVDDLERSALMSPTPPLTECEYPLWGSGEHYHCASSRRSVDLTLSLTIQPCEKRSESPACTRVLTPPDVIEYEPTEGPVDHVDCEDYYKIANSGAKRKSTIPEGEKPSSVRRDQLPDERHQPLSFDGGSTSKGPVAIKVPSPPPHLSADEAKLFRRHAAMFAIMARGGNHGDA